MAITDLRLKKGRNKQRILHLLIVKGSWRDLRRPSGYPIPPDNPHTNAGSTSHKAASPERGFSTKLHQATNIENVLRRTVYYQSTSSTQLDNGNANMVMAFRTTQNIHQHPQHDEAMPMAAPATPLTMP